MRSSDRPASLGRRALPAIALAGLSGVVLTQLDRPASNAAIGAAPRIRTTTTLSGGTGGRTGQTTVTNPTGTISSETLGTPRTTIPSSTVPSAPRCAATAVTGPTVDTRWGPVQVSATLTTDGTSLCSADAPVTPSDRNRSIFINDRAVPIINDEVKSQGVNFDSVSGATVTSDGYRQSLQALLDGQRG